MLAAQRNVQLFSGDNSPAGSRSPLLSEAGSYQAQGSSHDNLQSLHMASSTGHEEQLPTFFRGGHVGHVGQPQLPTVSEDDVLASIGAAAKEALKGQQQQPELAEYAAAAARGSLQFSEQMDPSYTLLVRHVAPDAPDEELTNIFQAFGDLQGIHTASKQLGLVVVSYYDIRAAISAQSTLHGTLIKNVPIDVQFAPPSPSAGAHAQGIAEQGQVVIFNLDPETSNEQLVWLFSKFGDVQGIKESPARPNQKFIRFYDLRHAAAAHKAMNRAEHMSNLPSHLTPQQVATLQSHTSGPDLAQLAQMQGMDDKPLTVGSWDGVSNSSRPATMEGLLNLVKQQGAGLKGSQQQQQSGMGNRRGGQQQQELHSGASSMGVTYPQLAALESSLGGTGARGLPPSDSASSIASVPGSMLMSAHSGGAQAAVKGPTGAHMPLSANTLRRGGTSSGSGSSNNMAGAAAAGSGTDANNAAAAAAAMYNAVAAAADRQAAAAAVAAVHEQRQQQQQQLQMLQASEAANMLMSLNLGGGMDASTQGYWGVGNDAASLRHMGLGNLAGLQDPNNSALWQAAAGMYGSSGVGGMQDPLAAAFQDLQLRQQQQQQQQQQQAAAAAAAAAHRHLQQQQALQAASAVGGLGQLGNTTANLHAAAQILQAAGLSSLGQAPYLPSSSQQLSNAAAAAQILQQAGLGLPQMAALGMGGGAGGLHGLGMGHHGMQQGMGRGMGGGGRGQLGGDGGNRSGGRLSRRTTDPVAEAERKAQQEKLYALDLEKIARGEDRRTTLMIKNIPNKYTQKMLLASVDEHFKGTYDFFYLPIDFKNKCNVGYAFINMVQPINIIPLVQRFNHKKWERFNSEKVCHISYARIQGRAALVQHFQNSSLMHEDKRCRPILFTLDDSGDNAGEQEAFPPPAATSGGLSGAGSRHGSGTRLLGLAGHGSTASLRSNGGSSNSLRERDLVSGRM